MSWQWKAYTFWNNAMGILISTPVWGDKYPYIEKLKVFWKRFQFQDEIMAIDFLIYNIKTWNR